MLFSQYFMRGFNFICNRVLCQFRQEFYFCIDDRPHTVRNMFLMSPVNSHTFLAVTMIAAGFLTWAMVFVFKFFSESRGKFFLLTINSLKLSFYKLIMLHYYAVGYPKFL